ncbi:MAG: tetratricopeptide repeat protein [Pseudomonadota bacterium]
MTINWNAEIKRFLFALCTVVCGGVVNAQPLDDVSLEFQEKGVVATILLTGPVQYQRHFPESHGKTLEIFYDRVQGATSTETWVDNEVRKSPPSNLIPSFTVTTHDQQTKPKLVVQFSREAEYSVAVGKDNRSLLVTIRPEKRPMATGPLPLLPSIKLAPAAVAAETLTSEAAAMLDINMQARTLMVQGREALAAKNNEAAVDVFNKLLLLPPNDFSQDGQEWVGVARERAKQLDKARVEYELYLRLYPEGEGAAQVAQRLASMSGKDTEVGIIETKEKVQKARLVTFGSISSRYYYGRSKLDSTQTFNNAAETLSTSMTDQSMLISSVDASERYLSDDYDGRLVFRDVNTLNLLSNKSSINRVSSAYGEIKSRKQCYLLRVGRQSAYGGGVMGRFDGLAGSYGDSRDLRFNGVAGTLADYSTGSKPTFFGASVDAGAMSFYGINQNVDGVLDRRAVGAEWRYYEDKKSYFALVDYDANFKALNAAQVMGTFGVSNAMVNFMLDHRKTPSLSIRNALNGAGTSSINALLQATSASSLRSLALARTATANSGQLGVTLPFKDKWQVGGDFRLSSITGLSASGETALEGVLPASASRGAEKSITGQVIGSNLLQAGDIWSVSTTLNTSSAVNGLSLFLYNHTQLKQGWAIDSSVQLYNQKDQFGGTTKRFSPMVRGAYRIKEQITLDVDGGYEITNYGGGQQTNKTTRFFFSGGVRWDF